MSGDSAPDSVQGIGTAEKQDAAPEPQRGVKEEILSWLPDRVLQRYTTIRAKAWFGILKVIAGGIIALVFYNGIKSLIGRTFTDVVSKDLWPWLQSSPKNKTWLAIWAANATVVSVALLVVLFFASCILLILAFSAMRKKSGTIDNLGVRTSDLQKERDELSGRVQQLGTETRRLDEIDEDIQRRSREADLMLVMNVIDLALVQLVQQNEIQREVIDRFFHLVFRKMFRVLCTDPIRACVYIPDPSNTEWLIISDWETVGAISKSRNRYYIGPDEPVGNKRRGIPGTVFCSNSGQAVPAIVGHEAFVDVYEGERSPTAVPYESGVFVPIRHPDGDPLGVLVFDSMSHTFTDHDLFLVGHVADRLGIVLNVMSEASIRPTR